MDVTVIPSFLAPLRPSQPPTTNHQLRMTQRHRTPCIYAAHLQRRITNVNFFPVSSVFVGLTGWRLLA